MTSSKPPHWGSKDRSTRTINGVEISKLTQRVAPTPERRDAVEKLVKAGGLRHPEPGQYYSEAADPEFRATFPSYELGKIRDAFPRLLQIDFDQGQGGLVVVLKDGHTTTEIPIGEQPPETTERLVEIIQEFMRGQMVVANLSLSEASKALEFDDE